MDLFGRFFRSILVFLGRFPLLRLKWDLPFVNTTFRGRSPLFPLNENLPVTSEGLLLQRCGYRPNEQISLQLTQRRSPGKHPPPPYTGVNTAVLKSDGNGCIFFTWTSLAGECRQDPGQTFKIEIKYYYESNNMFKLIGIYDCRGQRVG